MADQTIPPDFDLEELLACARYGELPELQALLASSTAPASTLVALSSPQVHNSATALHMASANGHLPVVEFLISQLPKSALDLPNAGGNTALHWASLNGHIGAVELLLKAGADPKLLNKAGKDALWEAEGKGLVNVCELLVKYGAGGIEGEVEAGEGEAGPSTGEGNEEDIEGEDADEDMDDAEGAEIANGNANGTSS